MNIEALLVETPKSAPCGPSLDGDAAFIDFEILARGKPEQRMGNSVVAGEEPPWSELITRGAALLGRSKDLRIASTMVRALVHTEGYAGLRPGLQLVHGLLERYWPCVHPQLDADDGDDPTRRLNAIISLTHPLELLRDLRAAPLVRTRQYGQLLVRDIEVALGKLPARADAPSPSQAQIDAMLAATAAEDGSILACAADTLATVKALISVLEDKVGPAATPDFKPLLATVHAVAQTCARFQPAIPADPSPPPAENEAPGAVPQAPAPVPAAGAAAGEIRSRQDALAMIDKVVAYLEHNEPTNPAPMLLRRGKRFMTMSFVDIVREISPDSVARIDVIAGPAQTEP